MTFSGRLGLGVALVIACAAPARARAGEGEGGGDDASLTDIIRKYVEVETIGRTLAHATGGDPGDPLVRNELSVRAKLRYTHELARLRATPRLELDDNHLARGVEPWIEDDAG